MNAPSENEPSTIAKSRLAEICKKMDASARRSWVLIICEVVMLVASTLALVDYWLLLPVGLRAAGALTLVAVVLFGLVRLVGFHSRPTRLKQGALKIESRRPELGCEISTAAEYVRRGIEELKKWSRCRS